MGPQSLPPPAFMDTIQDFKKFKREKYQRPYLIKWKLSNSSCSFPFPSERWRFPFSIIFCYTFSIRKAMCPIKALHSTSSFPHNTNFHIYIQFITQIRKKKNPFPMTSNYRDLKKQKGWEKRLKEETRIQKNIPSTDCRSSNA